jgi:hypothetical protein
MTVVGGWANGVWEQIMSQPNHAVSVRALFVGVLFCMLFVSSQAANAIETRSILETYFQTGSVPTGEDFKDLIDSFVNYSDDGLTSYRLTGIGNTPAPGSGPNGQGLRVNQNVGINEVLPYADLHAGYTAADLPDMEPQWAGNFGFLPLRYISNSTGQTHFAYLQGRMDASGTATLGPAFHAQYLVFETTAGQTLVTSVVPEPASLTFVAMIGLFCLSRRARLAA